ncbi:p22-1R [African swine fever virus]|uniref:p22-1R n=1 Tax=African swine fever virus TaxID=10497 RepID=A0A2Z5DG43_ASF|nr:p22-1R [African swine fever virus]AXB49395.1 p22-1R [African swine fever virus]AXB49569.1 p22-1R [African swine fever virus]AXB49912.1 p22-1R [African swine fever virus]
MLHIKMTISTLLIALIVLLIIILVVFLYYKKQQPPKKVCKVDKDCGSGEHCVRGTCSSLSCLDVVKMDKRDVKMDSKISSCKFTPNFYHFTDTAAEQEFGKTWHSIKITPSPGESHTSQEICERYCLWGTDDCTGWEYFGDEKDGTCNIYINPHLALKYTKDHVLYLPRNHKYA